MMAFKGFYARRATLGLVYPDNVTTFKQAARELAYMLQLLKKDEVRKYFSSHSIIRKITAERAPWWGDFCERLVRILNTFIHK